jgi:hypothetical protein
MKRFKVVFLLAISFVCFTSGVFVAYFRLPPYKLYDNALVAATAWHERLFEKEGKNIPAPKDVGLEARVNINKKGAWEGYTLFSNMLDTRVSLIDMDGKIVHRWDIPFSKVWKEPKHVHYSPKPHRVFVNFAHMYPNGDLLAVYHARYDTPFGYGLVKVDKDSNVLWAYDKNVHHNLSVGEDGNICILTQRIVDTVPKEIPFLSTPALADSVEILSPDGKLLNSIPLYEAFAGTGYEETLRNAALKDKKNDYLHINSAMVLDASMASQFPEFSPGQILVSLRNQSALAMLDPASKKIVWMRWGVWKSQHAAKFLPNGHILLFDNLGGFNQVPQSRVLEFDPATDKIVWAYPGDNTTEKNFFSNTRSEATRLPNGNTLIAVGEDGRAIEVSPGKEIVWQMKMPRVYNIDVLQNLQRVPYDEVTFLKK